MIEEVGTVVAIRGDLAEVRTERRSGCGACRVEGGEGGCGNSALDRVFGRRPVYLMALNAVEAEVGERVAVGVSEGALVGAALAVYLVPIAALLVGAVLGERLGTFAFGSGNLGALVGGFGGLALALSGLRRYSARLTTDPGRRPVVLRRQWGGGLPLRVDPPEPGAGGPV